VTLGAIYAKLAFMRHRVGSAALTLLLVGLPGCPGEDSRGETGAMTTATGSATSIGFIETSSSSGDGGGESSSGGMADGSSSSGSVAGSSSSSGGGGPVCDPPVVGEWNSCIDRMGGTDNTLCNWMGNSDGVGFLTCLSSSELEGGNVCIIRDCRDTCDCFDPPVTGTAEVVCSAILAGGENGCGLDCSDGKICPDGMECAGNLCWWPV
jgi:hypothetical protein